MATTPTDNLITFLKQGKVIPVIGAGVSAAVAGLPGWKQAIEHGFEFAETRNLNGAAIAQGKGLLEDGKLTQSADILKRLLNSPNNPFATWLDQLFGQPVIRDKALLTNIHKLCCPMILTTNYDNLIFKTQILGQKLIFDWSEFQEVQNYVARDEEFIFHLHGRINKPETIILSSEDYQRLANQPGYKTVLQRLWMNYHFLFIGCSKDGILDDDFITILNFLKTWFPSMPHQHFILVNDQSISNGEHLSLLLDCNVESVSYGSTYAQLPAMIDQINPNKDKLEERMKQLIEAYLEGYKANSADVDTILSRSKRYTTVKQSLDSMKEEFEDKKVNQSFFDQSLHADIGKLEMLIVSMRDQVADLLKQFRDLTARIGDGDVDEFITKLQMEDLDKKAEDLRRERQQFAIRKDVIGEKLRKLAQDYLIKAAAIFVNIEDPNRAEGARLFVDKALATFQDADILEEAARFYKIKLLMPREGVALMEKMLHLDLDLVTRMVALYTMGTMYSAFDKERAAEHLSKFCTIAENLKVNHPYLQTLYANGLHNLASAIADKDLMVATYRRALDVRRTAAKADPIYLSSLTFTAGMISRQYIEGDTGKFNEAFDEAINALETFLDLEHVEPVGFFEESCLAGLIVYSLGFRSRGMNDKFALLKGKFKVLIRKFDDYVVTFQPDHCFGVGEAYHHYFRTFTNKDEFPTEHFQWMVDRSIVHFKQSMKYLLPSDKVYFMLTYALGQKFPYKRLVERDHLAALILLKEAISTCKKIQHPDDSAKWLLSHFTRLDAAQCDCDDCQRARDAWKELGLE